MAILNSFADYTSWKKNFTVSNISNTLDPIVDSGCLFNTNSGTGAQAIVSNQSVASLGSTLSFDFLPIETAGGVNRGPFLQYFPTGTTQGTTYGTFASRNAMTLMLSDPTKGVQNGRELAVLKKHPTQEVDPYFDDVALFLTMDSHDLDIIDSSNNRLPITRSGTITVSNVKFSGSSALSYTSGGYHKIEHDGQLLVGTQDFTIELYVYLTSAGGTQFFFGNKASGIASSWYIGSEGGYPIFNGIGNTNVASSAQMGATTWYKITYSRVATVGRLYLNNILVATISDSQNYNSSNPFYVGSNVGANATQGTIDSVRLTIGTGRYSSSTLLEQSLVTARSEPNRSGLDPYHGNVVFDADFNTGMVDRSSNKKKISKIGAPVISTAHSVFGTGSVYFDGNSYLEIEDPENDFYIGGNDFTVRFNVWFDRVSTGNYQALFTHATHIDQTGLYVGENAGKVDLLYSPVSGVWQTMTGSIGVSVGTWYHIEVTRKNGIIYLFINGILSTSTSNSSISLSNDNKSITIGGKSLLSQYLQGYISNVQFINGYGLNSSAYTPPTVEYPLKSSDVNGNDGYWSKTMLLLDMDGSIKDDSAYPNDLTIVNGHIQTSTVPTGRSTSYYNDGTGSISFTGRAIGTADFCWESEVYQTTTDSNERPIMATADLMLYITSGSLRVYHSSQVKASYNTFPLNTWAHVVLYRHSGQCHLLVNGSDVANWDASTVDFSSQLYGVGCYPPSISSTGKYIGYLSDVRMTIGESRYSGGYTHTPIILDQVRPYSTLPVSMPAHQWSSITVTHQPIVNQSFVPVQVNINGQSMSGHFVGSSTDYKFAIGQSEASTLKGDAFRNVNPHWYTSPTVEYEDLEAPELGEVVLLAPLFGPYPIDYSRNKLKIETYATEDIHGMTTVGADGYYQETFRRANVSKSNTNTCRTEESHALVLTDQGSWMIRFRFKKLGDASVSNYPVLLGTGIYNDGTASNMAISVLNSAVGGGITVWLAGSNILTTSIITNNVWYDFCLTKVGSTFSLYLNGTLNVQTTYSMASTSSVTSTFVSLLDYYDSSAGVGRGAYAQMEDLMIARDGTYPTGATCSTKRLWKPSKDDYMAFFVSGHDTPGTVPNIDRSARKASFSNVGTTVTANDVTHFGNPAMKLSGSAAKYFNLNYTAAQRTLYDLYGGRPGMFECDIYFESMSGAHCLMYYYGTYESSDGAHILYYPSTHRLQVGANNVYSYIDVVLDLNKWYRFRLIAKPNSLVGFIYDEDGVLIANTSPTFSPSNRVTTGTENLWLQGFGSWAIPTDSIRLANMRSYTFSLGGAIDPFANIEPLDRTIKSELGWTPSELGSRVKLWYDTSEPGVLQESASNLVRIEDKSGRNQYGVPYNSSVPVSTFYNRKVFTPVRNSSAVTITDMDSFDLSKHRFHAVFRSTTSTLASYGRFFALKGTSYDLNSADGMAIACDSSGKYSGQSFNTTRPNVLCDYKQGTVRKYEFAGKSASRQTETSSSTTNSLYPTTTIIGVSLDPSANLNNGSQVGYGDYLMLSGDFTADEVNRIDAYLAHKWSVDDILAWSNPYKFNAPDSLTISGGTVTAKTWLTTLASLTSYSGTVTEVVGHKEATSLSLAASAQIVSRASIHDNFRAKSYVVFSGTAISLSFYVGGTLWYTGPHIQVTVATDGTVTAVHFDASGSQILTVTSEEKLLSATSAYIPIEIRLSGTRLVCSVGGINLLNVEDYVIGGEGFFVTNTGTATTTLYDLVIHTGFLFHGNVKLNSSSTQHGTVTMIAQSDYTLMDQRPTSLSGKYALFCDVEEGSSNKYIIHAQDDDHPEIQPKGRCNLSIT